MIEPLIGLDEIVERLESEYNDSISFYQYVDFVRMTNGSAAHRIDITISGDKIHLMGERYGEVIDKKIDRDLDALVNELRHTI